MIERLKETGGWAFGFKVTGKVSAEDIKGFEPQLEFAIAERKKRPIGLLADVTEMDSIDLKARWEELRFLHKYSDHIARVALVGGNRGKKWFRRLSAEPCSLPRKPTISTPTKCSRHGCG